MAGTVGQGANVLGNILIPETMANLRRPGMIEQAKREQQVGNIQAGRLFSGMNQEIGTPQTKRFSVPKMDENNYLTGEAKSYGQDNPSTVQPLFSKSKQMGLFSQAFPELGREFAGRQLMEQISPQKITGKDRYIDTPQGVFDVVTQQIVKSTAKAAEPTKGVVVNGRLVDPITGRKIADYSDPPKETRSLAQIFEDRFGTKIEPGMRPVMGPDGNFDPTGRQEPAPGASKDHSIIEAERMNKLQADMPNARSRYLALTQPIRSLVGQIPAIKNDPNTLDVVGVYEGGTNDEKWRLNPFTAQGNATAASRIENLRNVAQSIGLNIVRAGGVAPGSVTEREWPKFEAFVANIDTKQGEDEFMNQIGKAEEMGKSLLESMRNEFKSTYGVDPEGQSAAASVKTGPEYLKSLLDKYPARN